MNGELERLWRQQPALRRFVDAVLDRRDARGRLPRTIRYQPEASDRARIEALLPPRVLERRGDALHVDLTRLERLLADEARDRGEAAVSLEAVLDGVAGRRPRDRRTERARWREEVGAALTVAIERGRVRAEAAGASHEDTVLARYLDDLGIEARTGRGFWVGLARAGPLRVVAAELELLVVALALARAGRTDPARLDDLALAAAGHTKALRPGTEAYARLADALYALDPELAAQVDAELPGSAAVKRRLTLEGVGLVVNDASVDVLLQGPLALCLGEVILDDATKLARARIAAKLTLAALRAATAVVTPARLVTTVENEGAFHARAAAAPDGELVVLTAGQANWAVVLLLRALARAHPTLAFRHAGDLDPAGFAILRSLRRRTGLAIRSLGMSRSTLARCRDRALGLSPAAERAAVLLLEGWPPGEEREALYEILRERLWLEQEAVVARLGWELEEAG